MVAARRHAYRLVVIRNAIIHLIGEQPLLADLPEPPSQHDVGLLCTNVRYMNGRRPIFIEQAEALFLFPMAQIRFVEIPQAVPLAALAEEVAAPQATPEPMPDLDLDDDFLRRIKEA